jgi:hypothetical protein
VFDGALATKNSVRLGAPSQHNPYTNKLHVYSTVYKTLRTSQSIRELTGSKLASTCVKKELGVYLYAPCRRHICTHKGCFGTSMYCQGAVSGVLVHGLCRKGAPRY